MEFLLKLPPLSGSLVAISLILVCTWVLLIGSHIFFGGKRPKEMKTYVQQMAVRIGTMHALVVALVFSILTGELKKLHTLSDTEAISAANIYFVLKGNQSKEAAELRSLIPIYLKTVLEKDWKVMSRKPHDLPAWKLIGKMQETTLNWKISTRTDEMLKGYVFDNLNTMAENRNKRIIEWQADLPPVFWVIAILGYFLTIIPFLVIELNKRRFLVVSCYATIIGILFYGISVLDKPFSSGAIKPTSFQVMYSDILESEPS